MWAKYVLNMIGGVGMWVEFVLTVVGRVWIIDAIECGRILVKL